MRNSSNEIWSINSTEKQEGQAVEVEISVKAPSQRAHLVMTCKNPGQRVEE